MPAKDTVQVNHKALRAAFEARGLSQTELAKETGIHISTLGRILKGSDTSLDYAKALAKALKVSLTAILEQKDDWEPLPSVMEYLEQHAQDRKITARERYYLEHSRFKAEPFVVMDTEFWDSVLAFWRSEFKRLDEK
jgi:transcriptional regulator with XRE-family HTH domain